MAAFFVAWPLMLIAMAAGAQRPVVVQVPLNASSEVDISEILAKLADASGIAIPSPARPLRLPLDGRAAPLTLHWLGEALGPGVKVMASPGVLTITLPEAPSDAISRAAWAKTLGDLASLADAEIRRRANYGFHARPSFKPSDPGRQTVVLIHGLNSTSGVFRHLFAPLEEAGYGLITYDFPYNKDLDESSADFRRDWAEFRKKSSDSRPWAIAAHSMGSLLARSYVEDDASYARDVSSLILIAPPNHGSTLARGQTLLQTANSVQALRGTRKSEPLSLLGDGVGLAADDMTPGSGYLAALNANGRRVGVRYHLLAGDVAYLDAEGRRRFEAIAGTRGLLGGFGKFLSSGLSNSLDEITDGLGDGCVSVASTRLEGVTDHQVIHANHLELIRAPLLYPEPGPVASMPDLLRWLGEDRPKGGGRH